MLHAKFETIINTMGIKLVIVDDAPFIREAIRNMISGTEIELIAEAEDGESAISVAEKTNPDVIMMDMVLPKKNGIEAAKKILESNPSAKIVACSTEGQESLLIQAIDAGCVSFLAKPFRSEELLRAIRSAGRTKR